MIADNDLSFIPFTILLQLGSAQASSLAEFKRTTISTLEAHAVFTSERLGAIPGLQVIVPQVRSSFILCVVGSVHVLRV